MGSSKAGERQSDCCMPKSDARRRQRLYFDTDLETAQAAGIPVLAIQRSRQQRSTDGG
jgi:hypothetical protein